MPERDTGQTIDVLVVSHACVTAVNRAPYSRLAKLGWRVEIVTADRVELPDISRAADPRGPEDPPIHFLPLRTPAPRFWTFAGLRQLLESRRPRVILLDYDPGSRIAIEVGWWTRHYESHIVCFSYDNMPRTVRAELANRALAGAARIAMVQLLSVLGRVAVDHVWVLSNDSARAVESLGFRGKVSKIPLGFDPEVFKPDPLARTRVRAELGLDRVTFAYFGRLVPEKGVHLLIRALHGLRDYKWQLLLDKFGEYPHPYERELAQLIAELDLGDRVVFFDAPHSAVAAYMNAADVVVVPSTENPRWKEQYGRVAPEAMACGKLVVVSDSGALPELVGDAGIVIPHDDVDAISTVAERILTDPTLAARYVQPARERALRHLSLPVQVQQMHDLVSRWATPSGHR